MHNDASQLIEHISEIQNAPQPETSGAAPDELRYVLEAFERRDIESLEQDLRNVLPVEFALEPLFGEAEVPFFLLRIPGVSTRDLPDTPFALSYEMVKALGLHSADPDLDDGFYGQPQKIDPNVPLPEIAGGCWAHGAEPADKHWAPDKIRAKSAWVFSQQHGIASKGQGILVAQPDTGISDHGELESGMFDLSRSRNFVEDNNDPTDPLIDEPGFDNPGHGTGTSSVLGSRGTGQIVGSAPAAIVVPIRTINSVVVFSASRVARAIDHARRQGCHVITMSLGGVFSWAVRRALRRAVEANMIVLAAAGNCVRLVVWPARLKDCIAIGGINVDDEMWRGSSRGSAVDVAAPAELVWRARNPEQQPGTSEVKGGEGTSFAVAMTAGVASLWLAHHGRDNLINSLNPGEVLQERFRALLKATARAPAVWDSSKLGAGIVHAEALLMRDPADIAMPETAAEPPVSSVADAVAESLAMDAEGPVPEFAAAAEMPADEYHAEMACLALKRAWQGQLGPQPESAEIAPGGRTDFLASASLAEAIRSAGSGLAPLVKD